MDDHQALVQLHQSLCLHFNINELRQLCFELNVEHENLPEQTKDGLARELIRVMDRHGRILDLIVAIQQRHPETKTGVRVYEHGRYNLAANFVGRATELQELNEWQADASRPMFVIVALGGTGTKAP
jgi:hypothetical protein